MRKLIFSILFMGIISVVQLLAQDVEVKGKITDASTNEALEGVNILIKGTHTGVTSGPDGSYKISVPVDSTLVFSYIGYLSEEKQVTGQENLDITLIQSTEKLGEVVVIGYGTVKKTDATGSVATVSSSDFNSGTITSPENLITGKVSGVVITSNSGAPGVSSTIRIRGGSSLSASNDPLIVIDGVPVEQNVGGTASPLAAINPADIESFTILKDASATAIYGSRASNGVIIITTKRGTKKFHASYSAQVSINTLPKEVPVLSGDEFRSLVGQLSSTQSIANNPVYVGTANTDWQKEIYRTSVSQDHNLSFSGLAAKIPYRVSAGYTNDPGILKNTVYERTSASVAADPTLLKDHLTVNVNFKISKEYNNFNDQGAIADAVLYDPTLPVMNTDATRWKGYTTWTHDNTVNGDGVPLTLPGTANPVAKLDLTSNTATLWRSIGNVQFDYKFHFLPDLHAKLNLAYDYHKTTGHNNVADGAQWIYFPSSGAGRIENYSELGKDQLLTFNLNYTKAIESLKSNVSVMAGYEWSHFWKETQDSAMNAALTENIKPVTNPKGEYYIVSFFGRLNYILMDKYLLTFTLRDDGTSRFSSLNRWGLFPSAAFAWKINEESFLKGSRVISDLKFRLGYGVTGQQNVSGNYYPYLPTFVTSYDPAQYPLGENNFVHMIRPNGYDQNLKWEETTTYNIALDYGFMDNRFTGSIEYYSRQTRDLINSINVPVGTNFTQPVLTNVGKLENKGFEFSIDARVISHGDFSWQLGYNLSYNENKITRLNYSDDPNYYVLTGSIIQGTISDQVLANKVGFPSNSFLVYQQVYDPSGNPVEGIYIDRNKDGKINSSDLYLFKKPAPDVVMGISSEVKYKNWDFWFSGRANFGNYVYNNVAEMTTYNSFVGELANNYIANVTRYAADNKFTTQQKFSDYWIENASFFRMDNLRLGYTFNDLFKKSYNLNVNFSCQNVFVITKYKGIDPEVNGGIDNNFYPRPRTYVIGLNFGF